LRGAGIDLIGAANHHAADFGDEALTDAIANLKTAGLIVIGEGGTQEAAYSAHVFTTTAGQRVAVLALSDVSTGSSLAASSVGVLPSAGFLPILSAVAFEQSAPKR